MELEKYKKAGLLYNQTHPTIPITIWNYTDKVQWEGLWDEVTLSCRGIVVEDKTGIVVARPFKKFFNLSEDRTNVTSDYTIFQKYDGSLIILFYYKGEWITASRGSFISDQAIKAKEFLKDVKLDQENTYCFEIIYKSNRIVCDYGDFEGVILTGVFNTETGEELSLDSWGLPYARMFISDTPLSELQGEIKDNEEGYVVRFSNGERCKVKGAEYLRLHKMMSEMSTTAVWECLKNGDNILEKLKAYPDEFYESVKVYEAFLKSIFKFWKVTYESLYLNYESIEDTKDFALIVKEKEYASYMFSLRNGKNLDKQIWNKIKPEFKKL